MDAVECVATALCTSGKFETGEGTCALVCLDQLGSARKRPCAHMLKVHEDLAKRIVASMRKEGMKWTSK